MAEDLPFASASDVAERGGGAGFSSVHGKVFREHGNNESSVVQVQGPQRVDLHC